MVRSIASAALVTLALLLLATSGDAQTACPCTASYAPVCNPSGDLFPNKQCAVDCEGQNPALLCPCFPPVEPAGTPATEPCIVTADWAPVCDDNGTQVGVNQASAVCAGYTAEQLSPCEPVQPLNEPANAPCACTFDYRPVCDCTGFVIAPNACSAECLGFDPEQFRPCAVPADKPNSSRAASTATNETCVCPLIYAPVCDQYGVEVAPSSCTAECQSIEYSSPCDNFSAFVQPDNLPQDSCMCTYEYAPVCAVGSQRQLGSNACDAQCKGYSEEQFESCFDPVLPETSGTTPECTICTLEYFPQCLRNGTVVGSNPCQATCAGFAGEFLPCAVVQSFEGDQQPLVPSVLRPPCRCTKEYNPQCHVSSGALVGNNECNALCNGYDAEEIEACGRDADGKPLVNAPIQKICACPLIEAPVCDSMGTELGANACVAECRGYEVGVFSEGNCDNPTTCDTPCTADYRPVCDAKGTELGSNACVAECRGYEESEFSEEYCSQSHLLLALLPEIAERKEECKCTKEYRPVCDSQGTIVGANPCTARCAGYSDDSFTPCIFLELDSNSTTRSGSVEEGALIRLANSTDVVDYQVLCVESPVLNVSRLCVSYNSSIGFSGTPENGSVEPPNDNDSSAVAGMRSVAWALALVFVMAVAQL